MWISRNAALSAAATAHALDVKRVVCPAWPTHLGLAVEDRFRCNETEFLAAIRTAEMPLVTVYALSYSARAKGIQERAVIEIWGDGRGRYTTLDDAVHEFQVSGFSPGPGDGFVRRLLLSGILHVSRDAVLLKQVLADTDRPVQDWQENPANLLLSIRLPGFREYALEVPPYWEEYATTIPDLRILNQVIEDLFRRVPDPDRARLLPPRM